MYRLPEMPLQVYLRLMYKLRTKYFYNVTKLERVPHHTLKTSSDDFDSSRSRSSSADAGFLKIDQYILNQDNMLGQGAFGSVFEGKDEQDNSVAIKVLEIGKAFNVSYAKNMKQLNLETDIMTKCSHVNILKLRKRVDSLKRNGLGKIFIIVECVSPIHSTLSEINYSIDKYT